MLTKLTIRNFKLFDEVELKLDKRVVLVGPNNTGKTTVFQALALWEAGVKRWVAKRGETEIPSKRPGVTINRRELISVPVPAANLLWRNLRVRKGAKNEGRNGARNVLIEIIVEGIGEVPWKCGMEFDYANEEVLYCRPLRTGGGERMEVPSCASRVDIAYLPPMSGMAANEELMNKGAVNTRLGQGRTAEVLRNICYQIRSGEDGEEKWEKIAEKMKQHFSCEIKAPEFDPEPGQLLMKYRTSDGVDLDISAGGRGQQQTLLLLAHMSANRGSVLLLDEPDAHLEILRQRGVYNLLREVADETGSQIIAASHSEVLLNEALERDTVVAFVGKPHKVEFRSSQVAKSLKDIGPEHYLQAMQRGWILFLEGSTDLAILRQFARTLEHKAEKLLDAPYVHYVGNQPRKAHDHFFGLREANSDLKGIAIYDRLDRVPERKPDLVQLMWNKREIENYLCSKEALINYAGAHSPGNKDYSLFDASWREAMETSISELEEAMAAISVSPVPWSTDIKASDEFLTPLFDKFYEKVGTPNQTTKGNYYEIASFLSRNEIDPEVSEKLDAILSVMESARGTEE